MSWTTLLNDDKNPIKNLFVDKCTASSLPSVSANAVTVIVTAGAFVPNAPINVKALKIGNLVSLQVNPIYGAVSSYVLSYLV